MRGATNSLRDDLRASGHNLLGMVQIEQRLRAVMRPHPVTIQVGLSLEDARQRMFEHHIRHLPVVDGGRLVGLLSDRDVGRAEASRVPLRQQKVEDVMTTTLYICHPDELLARVATDMANHRYGCAIVVERDHIVGMFTTVDALHRLAALCGLVEMMVQVA